ncbi:uncharacterized protein LOC142623818 [Castanea sativa]|uniref:uncharacterized protein LOC142623818 n=1 Tax=Castanea sativa TaxID=21020 RepID=UPI003F652E23
MGGRSSESSSGEEDGDADWKAKINSVASSSAFSSLKNGSSTLSNNPTNRNHAEHDDNHDNGYHTHKPQQLKHYQVKAQKILDDILEKTLVTVRDPVDVPEKDPETDEGGIRLFKHAPPGIAFDHIDELQQPRKRPRILPGKEIDEKSKKFRRQIQSVAVGGEYIMAAARDTCQKSLARLEAKDAAAKAAANREKERVAELKRIRGERWLPSIAKKMQVKLKG